MKSRRMLLLATFAVLPLLITCLYFGVLSAMATRPKNLGVKNGQLSACPASPNCVCTQATDAEHRSEPLAFSGSVAEAKERLKRAVATLPRTKLVKEDAHYLHFEATSFLFRFVDDVEFYFDESRSLIHFRSASRVGYSDLGVNRKRMEQIRAVWDSAK